jgi:hypothetical protein
MADYPVWAGADTDNTIPEINKKALVDGLAYYCVVEINASASSARCPAGTIGDAQGFCTRVISGSGNTAVRDTLEPACPYGLEPMYGNALYKSSITSIAKLDGDNGKNAAGGGTPNSTQQTNNARAAAGTLGFPNLTSGASMTSHVTGTAVDYKLPKQVCAKRIDDSNCEYDDTRLYRVVQGKEDYDGIWSKDFGPTVDTDDPEVVPWKDNFYTCGLGEDEACRGSGTLGKICVKVNEDDDDYVVSEPYSCSSVLLANKTSSVTATEITFSGAGTDKAANGCVILYASEGIAMCEDKDKGLTYDDQNKACKLKSEYPECETSTTIDGKSYAYSTAYETFADNNIYGFGPIGASGSPVGLAAENSFRACAIRIKDDFCPMNIEGKASGILTTNKSTFDFNDENKGTDAIDPKRCVLDKVNRLAGCKTGFTPVQGAATDVRWCEGG